MRLVGKARLKQFARRYSDARPQISAWVYEVEAAEWRTPVDIKDRYAHATLIADNRVVFNIHGNRYRIDTKVNYKLQIVTVVRVGTHEDYDQWRF